MIQFKEVRVTDLQDLRVIDLQNWDKFIQDTYSRPYSFRQQDGCKYKGVHEFSVPEDCYDDDDKYMHSSIPEKVNGEKMGVKFAVWLARDPKQKLLTTSVWEREHGLPIFWARNFYPDFNTLLKDLHKKGLIEEGDYLINIDC